MFRALAGTPALGPDRSRQRGDTSGAGDPRVRFDERGVETEAMVEPLRHRRTKGAVKRYARPTAAAPHLDSTDSRRRLERLKRANGGRSASFGAHAPRPSDNLPERRFAKLQAVCVVDSRTQRGPRNFRSIARSRNSSPWAPAQRRRSADAMSAAAVPADHHRHSGPRV